MRWPEQGSIRTALGLYDRLILPRLLACAMQNEALVPLRRRLGSAASGRVLEIGIGSALNLPFYGTSVREVVGIDPSPALVAMARERQPGLPFAFQVIEGAGERLPFEDASFDTVLTTWTLCSIGDPARALHEVRRVLRPGGQLLFAEHGRAPDDSVRWWQDRLTPAWKRIAGGCHLNRGIDGLIGAAGFRMDGLQTGYLPGPRPMTFMYEGRARPG